MEHERAFMPGTFVDRMFASAALSVGAAAKVVTEPASRVHDNLRGIRRVEAQHLLAMFGLRAKKIRPRATRRRYYK